MQPGEYGCVGRIIDKMSRCIFKGWDTATTDARDLALVQNLQATTTRDVKRVQDNNASMPGGEVLFNSLEVAQVSVLVVLSRVWGKIGSRR
jgi:hypothetical protein